MSIIKLANYYFNLCTFAGLETDMVKRILLSIIPHLTSPAENSFYQGFPNHTALKQAVQGVSNLLKYGVKACVDELYYYGEALIDQRLGAKALVIKSKQLLASGNLRECLELCVQAFEDRDSWERYFGGDKWAKIAKTLLRLCKLRDRMETVRQALATEKDTSKTTELYEQERSIMKEIIVDMNVFDGLAHNSGSIYDKMVSIEADELKLTDDEKISNLQRVHRLMDSKELTNPIDVYKELEEPLRNSGESYPFRDVMQKAQKHPDYYTHSKRKDQIKEELEVIRARKVMIAETEALLSHMKDIVKLKETAEANAVDGDFSLADKNVIKNNLAFLDDKIASVERQVNYRKNVDPDVLDSFKKYQVKIKGWVAKCNTAITFAELFDLNNYFRYLQNEVEHLCDLARSI